MKIMYEKYVNVCEFWMLKRHSFFIYRVFRKKFVFSQFTATPPSPSSLYKRPSKLTTQCECTVISIGW